MLGPCSKLAILCATKVGGGGSRAHSNLLNQLISRRGGPASLTRNVPQVMPIDEYLAPKVA